MNETNKQTNCVGLFVCFKTDNYFSVLVSMQLLQLIKKP